MFELFTYFDRCVRFWRELKDYYYKVYCNGGSHLPTLKVLKFGRKYDIFLALKKDQTTISFWFKEIAATILYMFMRTSIDTNSGLYIDTNKDWLESSSRGNVVPECTFLSQIESIHGRAKCFS